MGLAGKYCLKDSLPVHLIMASLIAICLCGL